jgi:hypothetical protein
MITSSHVIDAVKQYLKWKSFAFRTVYGYVPGWGERTKTDERTDFTACDTEVRHARCQTGLEFAHTSPYTGCKLVRHHYSVIGADLYGRKVLDEADFRNLLNANPKKPELMIMDNFIVERAGVLALCRANSMNCVTAEDGFFPHYDTMHADPLGFCRGGKSGQT